MRCLCIIPLQKKKRVPGTTVQEARCGTRFVDLDSLAFCNAAGVYALANQSGRRAVTLVGVQLPHTRVSLVHCDCPPPANVDA